jgi:hypothetical protein
MRSIRALLGIGLLVLLAACTEATASTQPAVWVEVSPGTVPPGALVAVRGDCEDNDVPATASSKAFGTVTLQPTGSFLQTEIRVPGVTAPGRYEVKLTCNGGQTATTTLTVVQPNEPTSQPTVGPHTGGGFLGGGSPGTGGL